MSEAIETPVGSAVLHRTDRKTLAISVHPDGSLELVAPMDAAELEIGKKVAKRRKWILTQRRKFLSMNAARAEPRYVTGATHRYLGRQYRLKISRGQEPGVSLKGAYFHITVKSDDPTETKILLAKWFRAKAADQFTRRLDAWSPWCAKHRVPKPTLRLLKMPKRWGSASPDGRIALNPELVHMPSRCIDYVITHEICHLKHPNHGPQFHRMLTSLMPDWKRQKERMEHLV
jgi:hypothetical protein